MNATGESPPSDDDKKQRIFTPEMISGTLAVFLGSRVFAPECYAVTNRLEPGDAGDGPGRSPDSPRPSRDALKQTPEPHGSAGPDGAGGR